MERPVACRSPAVCQVQVGPDANQWLWRGTTSPGMRSLISILYPSHFTERMIVSLDIYCISSTKLHVLPPLISSPAAPARIKSVSGAHATTTNTPWATAHSSYEVTSTPTLKTALPGLRYGGEEILFNLITRCLSRTQPSSVCSSLERSLPLPPPLPWMK